MTDSELSTWIADCSPCNGHPPALDGVPRDVFLRLAERCLKAESERAEACALVAAPYQVYFREGVPHA